MNMDTRSFSTQDALKMALYVSSMVEAGYITVSCADNELTGNTLVIVWKV